MNRKQNCAECKFMKKYDYGKKIYPRLFTAQP